ncbi:hypothetical protein [Rhodopirellula sp. MGV]|uniref:hypothetical protein n=1 Tax=Rhodopirellula sp. MGV TaxID=2023130 RepID=UPI0013044552|nr:hypothetical protein [Rhodopirellula sp. MGV]
MKDPIEILEKQTLDFVVGKRYLDAGLPEKRCFTVLTDLPYRPGETIAYFTH